MFGIQISIIVTSIVDAKNLHNFMHNCTEETRVMRGGKSEAKGAMHKYLHMSHAQSQKGAVGGDPRGD